MLLLYLEVCKYTKWSDWTLCITSCGENGNQTRRKTLINQNSSSTNASCEDEIVETSPCTGDPCPCIQDFNCTCNLTDWSQWSSCSLPCGGGQRDRTRQYETDFTENCPKENLREVQSCNVDCCPIDGGLSPWSVWSSCTKTCDSGVQKRYRTCTNPPPSCAGNDCDDHQEETQVCNTEPCGM